MASAELVQVSKSYFKIVSGRKVFGYVSRGQQDPAAGRCWGGQYRFNGTTLVAGGYSPAEVFGKLIVQRNEAFAKANGFSSSQELDAANQATRAKRRARLKQMKHVLETQGSLALVDAFLFKPK